MLLAVLSLPFKVYYQRVTLTHESSITLCNYSNMLTNTSILMITLKNLMVVFYSQVLQNGFLQIDFFSPVALVMFCSESLFA